MSQPSEHCESCSINWIAVVLLGLVLPIAVVTVVALFVTTSPQAPKDDTPEAVARRIGLAAAPAKPEAPASAAKPETPPPAKSEAKAAPKPDGKPAAKPESKPEAKPEAKPQAKPEAKPAASAEGDKGKAVYAASCAACHANAVAGAPKFGDKAAWAPRIKTGKDALYTSALKGKNAMPPKGGNAALPDSEVKAAVDYMVNAAQ